MVRIDARIQKSKAIKGSVFEQVLCGTKNDYVIVSSTDFNANNGMALCSKIVPYTDNEKNNLYAIPFEIVVSNMVQKICVLTNTQYTFKVSDFKVYKYHIPQELIDQIDQSYMDIIFGKRLYTMEECRQAVAEDDIRLKVQYENNILSKESDDIQVPQVESYNMSVEDEQSYYAQMHASVPKAEENTTTISNKTEAFNAVLPPEFKLEEDIVEHKKPVAKLDKKKVNATKSKSGADIVIIGSTIKKDDFAHPDKVSKSNKPSKRSYVNRSQIWKAPEIFLLDVATKSRPEIMEIYSINTWSQAYTIISKCHKLCEERNINLSFLKEDI